MSLKIIEPNKVIRDAIYIEDFEFNCGRKVPMYQVNSIYALTQIIGYVKYINASYGNVLYRGQCKLYKTIEPSIYHGIESTFKNEIGIGSSALRNSNALCRCC